MERRQSQKQSALTQLAKKGLVTTNPTPVQRALAELSSNVDRNSTKKSAGRRRARRVRKTHKKNRKSYF